MTGVSDKLADAGAPPARSRAVLGAFLRQPYRPVVIAFLTGMLLFGGVRLGQLLGHAGEFAHESIREILTAPVVGAAYDALVLAVGLLPLAAVVLIAGQSSWSRSQHFRRAVCAGCALLFTVMAEIELIGIFFFREFHWRLNWLAVDYLSYPGTLAFVWHTYPVWLAFVVGAGVVFGFYKLFMWAFWRGPAGSVSPRLMVVLAAAAIAACVAADFTGWSPLTARGTMLSFTDNSALAQLSQNDFCTLARAVRMYVVKGGGEADLYDFPAPELVHRTVEGMLLQPGDTPRGGAALFRHTVTGRPMRNCNVVLIVGESFTGRSVGAMGHSPSDTPCFDKLAADSLFFTRTYGVGDRTSRGLTGTLCSHVDLGGPSVLSRPEAQGRIQTLAGVLQNRGYHTMFFYGGDPEFDDMGPFFLNDGFDEFFGRKQMPQDAPVGYWGFDDEAVFARAHQEFLARSQEGKPFFGLILTVSNHEPFKPPQGRVAMLPEDSEANMRINSFRYADWCIGQFFDKARSADYFKNTIFVFVADHATEKRLLDVAQYRLPWIIHAPGIVPPGTVPTVCSQVDIAPTVMGMLGGEYDHRFMGRDILKVKPDQGFALLHKHERLAFIQQGKLVMLDPAREPAMFDSDGLTMDQLPLADVDRPQMAAMIERALSLYALAWELDQTGTKPGTTGR